MTEEVHHSYPTTKTGDWIYVVCIPRKKFQVCPNCGNKEIYLGYDYNEEPAIVCEACMTDFKFHTSPTSTRSEE